MILRKAVLLLAATAIATGTFAHAQFGVYGMFTVDRLSNIDSSPLAKPNSNLQPVNPLGGTGGVYYDFMKLGPLRLGADVRGSIVKTKRGANPGFDGSGARIYSALGGIRGVFHTPFAPLKPYIQASVGLGRSDYGLGPPVTIHSNFEYQGLAGLDVKLLPIMDWRVAELGYGGLNPFGTNSHNYPIKQVSMGFVFHLP